jgi:TolA-binding protein
MKQKTLAVWTRMAGVLAILVACAAPATAQSVTSNDIQALQEQVYQASTDISRLRGTSQDSAARLQTELDDLRDEVAYLRVKMRREGNINRSDYTDVRDRLRELRSRAAGDTRSDSRSDNQGWRTNSDRSGSTGANGGVAGGVSGDDRTRTAQDMPRNGSNDDREPTTARRGSNDSAIPSGQEIDVRLDDELSSETAQVEQRFQATTVADLFRGNEVLIPAGSVIRGVVSGVTKTTRMERKGALTLAFDQLTIRGRNYPMRGTVTSAIESAGIKGEATKIGAGAGVGAIIGGILGGAKGALLGVLIGGGGTVAATEGKDVTLPAGTVLRVRLDTPPAVR